MKLRPQYRDTVNCHSLPKVIVLVTIFLLAAALLSSCNENEKEKSQKDPKPKEKIYKIGEVVSLNDWEFTIESAAVVPSAEDQFMTYTPDEDTDQFLAAFITIKNNFSEKRIFVPPIVQENQDTFVTLICKQKYKYSPTLLLGYQEDLNNATLEPLSTKTGALHFSYPKELGDDTSDMSIEFKSGGKSAIVNLQQSADVAKAAKKESSQPTTETPSQSSSETDSNGHGYCEPTSEGNKIVGMWAGDWMSNSRIEFDFLKNGEFYCSIYYEDNDSKSIEGQYWLRGDQLELDTGEIYTIKSVGNGVLKLKTYDGTFSLDRMAV
ncbi:DUF4352 domain-containing protein [Anaerovorax odorimutans]|uniref:DUF4352 domain-containing protein n=1 Tax=Anaerovorax odorimutans TaxID=109327 RepID=A0ABT1RJU9_9FIRM|nr:DUF4352 domain-containing protein [Anaerovorax odorimutans]MCQ4635448.1 DUF4352 domain-containing protein [Anaerovorax odorimutans]